MSLICDIISVSKVENVVRQVEGVKKRKGRFGIADYLEQFHVSFTKIQVMIHENGICEYSMG